MKQAHLQLLFLLLTPLLNAQEKQGIVNYGYIKSLIYGQKQGEEYKAQLLFDSKHSYFVTQKDSLEDSEDNLVAPLISEANEESRTNESINIRGSRLITNYVGNQVYFDREKDTLWSYIMGMGNIYIKEKKPTINWTFEKDTKKIGVFTCKKATATFRGRDYTVWYTTAIPIPYGPWKLNGLPGLVLEGYDSEYKIYFYFKNIEYPLKKKIKIDFIKQDVEERLTQWFGYKTYLKHAHDLIEQRYERSLMIAKDLPKYIPTKQKIEELRIEIAE
jgi:GLPGLI family protein